MNSGSGTLQGDIAVIGLGKVGLPFAAALAARGYSVHGYDADPARNTQLIAGQVSALEQGSEAGLAEALAQGRDALHVEQSVGAAVRNAALVFMIVPTPSMPGGDFSTSYVEAACQDLGPALAQSDLHPTVVLVSTVSPGSIDATIRPALEAATGAVCGEGISLCYAPALIALGDVVAGFMEPDFAFVGQVDARGADRLEAFYRAVLPQETPIHRMSAQSVEIAKLALNNFLTTKISFANLIGALAHRTKGADAKDILAALGADHRIGAAFLRHGMGYGGPCLPRDTDALAAALTGVGLSGDFPQSVARLNAAHTRQLARLVGQGGRCAVLGLGYKAGSPHTLASAAIDLCNALCAAACTVTAYDIHAPQMDLSALAASVTVTDGLEVALSGADWVIPIHSHDLPANWAARLTHTQHLVMVDGGMPPVPCAAHVVRFGQGG